MFEYKCGLNETVSNSKPKWNPDECWCECKESNDWGSSKNNYIWNLSMCNCECYKTCKIDEYLNDKNCSCEKNLIEFDMPNKTETLLDDKK